MSVHVRVPSQQYDEAYRVAREQRTSVQELIRRGLVRALDGEREDDDGET